MDRHRKSLKVDSVKEARVEYSRSLSLGRIGHVQQVTPDHQPATACKYGDSIRIGTWNVKTLYQIGKLSNVIKEVRRMNISILGVAETRWTGSGKLVSDNMTIIYSGGEKHEGGVAFILGEKISRCMIGYWAVSPRVLLLKIRARPFDMAIIQVYAPTSDHSDEEVEEFYEELDKARKACKAQEVLIVMGDLNAKVGRGKEEQVVGPYGLGERNMRGDRWVEWCTENGLTIMNTWFYNHPRRLWTWKSPGDRVKNQIDYIAIDQRFRNSVKQAKGYPGADCGSDHVLIAAEIKIKLKKLEEKKKRELYDWKAIEENEEIKKEYRLRLQNRFQLLDEAHEIEAKWKLFKEALTNVTAEVVPRIQRTAKQPWMKKEILDLMEERRLVKNIDTEKYNEINKLIKKSCCEAKERWINEQCEEVEKFRNTPRIYEKIKEIAGKRKSTGNSCIKTKEGSIEIEEKNRITRWNEYIAQLYHDEREEKPEIIAEKDGPEILKEEVEAALKRMKRKKAAGFDNIVVEMLTTAEKLGVDKVTELVNMMYDMGRLPEDLYKSIFIAIPKKPRATECEEHRTISLISQITKLMLWILLMRVKGKLQARVSEEQYGFRRGSGCRNAIFILRMLSERCIEIQKDLYVCFIDYEKAFDNVRHKELFECLKRSGIDGKDLRIFQEVYWNQTASIRINGNLGTWIKILKGTRQGCVLSPDFFNIYGEEIMSEIEDKEGVSVGGRNINNLRFADDAALIADSQEKLQRLLEAVVQASENKGLKVNIKKTCCMVISKWWVVPACNIYINGNKVQQVECFRYLGSMFTSDGRCDKEIRARIGRAKSAFADLKQLLVNRKISTSTRMRLLKTYVWSVMLYGSETWTISKIMQKRLEAAEMWFLRRMMKISWTERKTNEQVLNMMNTRRNLMNIIRKRQLEFFGHIMRKNGLENLVVTGRVEGSRARGRQRLKFLDGLVECAKKLVIDCNDMIRTTGDRARWKSVVANAETQGT